MKPNQLHAFLAVTTQMSIRGAARELGVSPPAVTKTVRELEREVGAPLIERSVKGVQLTEFGAAFAPRARRLLDDMNRAREEIAQLRDGAIGGVRIGVSPSFAETLLVPAFKALRARRPAVTMYFSEPTFSGMLVRLREAHLDLAITHVSEGSLDPEFESLPLFPVQLVIGLRNRHPLRDQRSLRGPLLDAEWILPGDGNNRNTVLESGFTSLGLPVPARIMQGDSVNAGLALVSQMDLVGCFAEPLAKVAFKRYGIRQLELEESFLPLQMCVIYRRDSRLTPAALQFIECIREVSLDMLG